MVRLGNRNPELKFLTLLDVKMRPKYHFHFGKTWAECINPVKRENQRGHKKHWRRAESKAPAELDPEYRKRVKINHAREQALRLIEGIEAKKSKENEAAIDPVISFVSAQVNAKIAKSAMIPPPTDKTMISAPASKGYHSAEAINRTDILTWTSKRGHTNQISQDGNTTDLS